MPDIFVMDAALDQVFGAGWDRLTTTRGGAPWPREMRVFKHVSQMHAIKTIEVRGGKPWIHVSISRDQRDPTYNDMAIAKHDLIGAGRKAIMVFAPQNEHVNIHKHCLHLFAALDGDDGLPDFRNEAGLL